MNLFTLTLIRVPSQNRGNVTLSLLRLLEWTDRLKRIRCPRGILELPSPELFLGGRQRRRLAQGGLRKAAEKLHVSQPTISAQIAALEGVVGEKLFRRGGRALA